MLLFHILYSNTKDMLIKIKASPPNRQLYHTFAGTLHMLQLFGKPQDFWVRLVTFLSQKMKQRCVLTDRFGISQLQKKNKNKNIYTYYFQCLYSSNWSMQRFKQLSDC